MHSDATECRGKCVTSGAQSGLCIDGLTLCCSLTLRQTTDRGTVRIPDCNKLSCVRSPVCSASIHTAAATAQTRISRSFPAPLP